MAGNSGKTWYDDQCVNLGNTNGDLSSCKSKCENKDWCNAINHKGNYCTLRRCPEPHPSPRSNSGGHVGYTGYRMKSEDENPVLRKDTKYKWGAPVLSGANRGRCGSGYGADCSTTQSPAGWA